MDIKTLLKMMVERNASDLFYRMAGTPRLKIDGKVVSVGENALSQQDISQALDVLMTPEQREKFKSTLDVDFAFYTNELERRFRVSIFMQRNHPSIVIRNINCNIMNFEELNLPGPIFERLSRETRGLVLLTGTMGSGKSTTIAGIIEYINKNLKKHILTVEEPIEFTFKDKEAIINQRELGLDVASYATALHAFTLQSPDVMYISNIRDQETMQAALTAAETGVLVLSTIHSVNASQSVERIINFFPPHQHQEIRNQLSYLLKGVISLRLIPLKEGSGRIPAYEILLLTPTISRLIREGKIWEIPQYIEEGAVFGMNSFNQCLVKLVKEGKISEAEAVDFVDSKDEFSLALKGIKKER
jgi:pilus retraction protein PilT